MPLDPGRGIGYHRRCERHAGQQCHDDAGETPALFGVN